MREFHAYEYVDGDVKVYVREKGEGDSAWRELGNVSWESRRKHDAVTIAESLNIDPVLTEAETADLSVELAMPRRH